GSRPRGRSSLRCPDADANATAKPPGVAPEIERPFIGPVVFSPEYGSLLPNVPRHRARAKFAIASVEKIGHLNRGDRVRSSRRVCVS
ncbi:MAG TPA: hypothetical protein VEM36_05125, partial [Xanthobacteraceae bacterium]|nr:hypothetical protein [Xanthobacteraceae bacterium]